MKDTTIEFEFGNLIIDAEIYYKEVDVSFSHEFGIEKRTELEVDTVEIIAVHDEEGEEVEYDNKELEPIAVDEFYNQA